MTVINDIDDILIHDAFRAAHDNNIEGLRSILSHCKEEGQLERVLSIRDDHDCTLLYYAAHRGYLDMVKYLIQCGARDDETKRCELSSLCGDIRRALRISAKKNSGYVFREVGKGAAKTPKGSNKEHGRSWKAPQKTPPAEVFERECPPGRTSLFIPKTWVRDWTPEDWKDMGMLMSSHPVLHDVDIRKCEIGGKVAEAFLPTLMQSPHISYLYMFKNSLGSFGASILAHSVLKHPSLTKLNICCNDIGDEGACYIADAVCQNPLLLAVDLNRNSIGDRGASAVAKSIVTSESIVHVSLMDNHISSQGASLLLEAVQGTPRILNCNVRNNPAVGDDTLLAIEAVLHAHHKAKPETNLMMVVDDA